MPDDDNIVLAHGFDEAFNGHDYFIPARYFLSNYNNLYNEVMPDGWSASDTGVRATSCSEPIRTKEAGGS